eukprot:TRINITY_DN13023_c0_g1_i2.p1 TRINITY_DN13023_c0_g1~~TRINITY_DN13023_c0_g1_i2.p1  ORF type:complete len:111 (+),score=12.71 TRINITY_DN13023_c0_g1_i2:90-422(+)
MHFSCYRLAVVGERVLYFDFAFALNKSYLQLLLPDVEHSPSAMRWIAHPGHHLEVQRHVSPLTRRFVFGSKLRSGLFLQEDSQPSHMCLSSEDMTGVYEWTSEDVKKAMR